jgi:hypothetical protein
MINDVNLAQPLDSGFRLVAVDGRPVKRQNSHWIDVIPYAILEPGAHTLTLERRVGSDSATTTVSASLEAGKRYRFKAEAESVVIVEDAEGVPASLAR